MQGYEPVIRILQGDARTMLATLPDASVHCCVTSPPYFGLRDYGVAGQIGNEATPIDYIAALVGVFREVRRALRDDGTLWLNLGDSYAGTAGMTSGGSDFSQWKGGQTLNDRDPANRRQSGLKPKDLMMMPARVALALQADGWWLRSDIIWAKPNPMPESVTDRPTSSHEHVFLLAKSARYYFDTDAVREEGAIPAGTLGAKGSEERFNTPGVNSRPPEYKVYNGARNLRNVWTIATAPYAEAHFATFPPELAERCIKAGTSERGCCAACGAPWVRQVERGDLVPTRKNYTKQPLRIIDNPDPNDQGRNRARDGHRPNMAYEATTTGWSPSCECDSRCHRMGCRSSGSPPLLVNGVCPKCDTFQKPDIGSCTILDPFAGAFTAPMVADRLQRHAIGIELSEAYCNLARARIERDAGMFAEIAS